MLALKHRIFEAFLLFLCDYNPLTISNLGFGEGSETTVGLCGSYAAKHVVKCSEWHGFTIDVCSGRVEKYSPLKQILHFEPDVGF
jgi:hypothetical protein